MIHTMLYASNELLQSISFDLCEYLSDTLFIETWLFFLGQDIGPDIISFARMREITKLAIPWHPFFENKKPNCTSDWELYP